MIPCSITEDQFTLSLDYSCAKSIDVIGTTVVSEFPISTMIAVTTIGLIATLNASIEGLQINIVIKILSRYVSNSIRIIMLAK